MTDQTGIWASSFLQCDDLDGWKTVEHHANSLFRVQVSTQNSDTMNESQCTTPKDRWVKCLLCKKYFVDVPVENIFCISKSLKSAACLNIWLKNWFCTRLITERAELRFINCIFGTGKSSFRQGYLIRQSPKCWLKAQMGDRPLMNGGCVIRAVLISWYTWAHIQKLLFSCAGGRCWKILQSTWVVGKAKQEMWEKKSRRKYETVETPFPQIKEQPLQDCSRGRELAFASEWQLLIT